MANDNQVTVNSAADIVTAREKGRALAVELGFIGSDLTMIATAISEVARNIVDHAKKGKIMLAPIRNGHTRGISVVAKDEGPGIANIPLAMQYGYSSRQGLGVGLPGAKWLMDDFKIDTKIGKGTMITMKKWLH